MNQVPTETPQVPPSPPRVVAISGIIFALLFVASLVLVRLAVPADPTDPGVWLRDVTSRNGVRLAFNLVPFTGVAFLWYMAVLRNRIGLREDRFFSTIFLGSGLLFVAMLFVVTALAQGLLDTFITGNNLPAHSETYAVGRSMAHALMNTFAMKMAAVFMFVTSTIGLRTAFLARWVSYVGFACQCLHPGHGISTGTAGRRNRKNRRPVTQVRNGRLHCK
jgi:hypothetical protein